MADVKLVRQEVKRCYTTDAFSSAARCYSIHQQSVKNDLDGRAINGRWQTP